ncbi:glycoside hydrolase family 3 C-terminal domain-containing protein [Frankia sp. CN7]|uniref:Glycoside hydrolase family 3 C-terminal domain-containing protein n=3 Tax=Frankia nepalensis TaxID=1836974 RepID=A0A937RH55_9ACTN|nr:glycoside hydrolase family 3 C-terminal domain-containing protein [Frankia nepalensis]MBL7498389.1 glycoside hydrolase family 3 C-terminal domain-containing protein [Frankia nepalensis]MBL7628885.1 glycoside hydrolase family 3 C-terminal domain-containing protein [Frankia nepalensis]
MNHAVDPAGFGFTFTDGVARVRAGELTAADAAELLVKQLRDDELLWLLDGDTPVRALRTIQARMRSGPITAGALPRLGIPGIRFSDGPRGVVMGNSTAFPVTMMRAATWDPDLEERVGHAMGLEARARGANYSGAVCVNLLRHPAWGRAQESYGEDPVLTGQLGAALTRGLRRNVMACVKHFALNSMENARFKVDVAVDEHALHEVYLPHFKATVDAGADSFMSSYNAVNGAFLDVNRTLLTDVLRDEWGFEGFVTSDWLWGVHDAVASLDAGMDVEMPLRALRARELPGALRAGRLPRETVLRSARRILATTLAHAATRDEAEPAADVVAAPAHRALAREAAVRGTVLLRNEPAGGAPLLPLPATTRRLAVLGHLAAAPNLGDHGSSTVRPPTTCSPLEGLREALPAVEIDHLDGADAAAAARAAAAADTAVVVVGLTHDDEGERVMNDDPASLRVLGFPFTVPVLGRLLGHVARLLVRYGRGGDRASLTLRPRDERLIAAVAAANPRTVVVVIGGSAILMEAWRDRVPAILLAFYPGMEGGRALGDVLTGRAEPGGRLPFAIPTDAAHLPFFDAEARRVTYDAWWGQRKLDRDGHPAAYPFGFGLGYTTFDLELTGHRVSGGDGAATVRVRNTGTRAGSTVAQVYAADADAPRPVPQLIGFRRVELAAGAATEVTIPLDLTPTLERDPTTRAWARRPGTWRILAAPHSPGPVDGAPLLVTG